MPGKEEEVIFFLIKKNFLFHTCTRKNKILTYLDLKRKYKSIHTINKKKKYGEHLSYPQVTKIVNNFYLNYFIK